MSRFAIHVTAFAGPSYTARKSRGTMRVADAPENLPKESRGQGAGFREPCRRKFVGALEEPSQGLAGDDSR
jgi:hypothetical protein